jgi:hypothetical protein
VPLSRTGGGSAGLLVVLPSAQRPAASLCPRRGNSLRLWRSSCAPATARVLLPTPRLADARRIERRGLPAALFAGDLEVKTGEFSLLFFCDFLWGSGTVGWGFIFLDLFSTGRNLALDTALIPLLNLG